MPSKKTGKPAQGEGNIYPLEDKPKNRCSKWRIVIPLGKLNGKYKQRKETFHGTYTEAHARRREMIIERDGRPWDADTTVGEWLDDFESKRNASGELSQRSMKHNATCYRAIKHHIKDVRFSELTSDVINEMYARMRAGDTRSGRPVSGTTVRNYHVQFKLALYEPMKKGYIDANLFEGIINPKRDTKEKTPLSTLAARSCEHEVDVTDPRHMAILLCLTLGLRRSEALAVRWEDIEFGVLRLRNSVDEDGSLKDPKTKAGRRALPIPHVVLEALRIRRERQRDLAMEMYYGIGYEGPVDERDFKMELEFQFPFVCSDSQTPILPRRLSTWWASYKKKLGVSCTLHELRHTFLTMLARKGVHPRVMQDLAGHESSQITMEIYTHVDLEQKESAMRALNTVFSDEIDAEVLEVSTVGDSSDILPLLGEAA